MATSSFVEDENEKMSGVKVTKGGVAVIDVASAALLLKENGVLESARKHMHFYKVVTKNGKKKMIPIKPKVQQKVSE